MQKYGFISKPIMQKSEPTDKKHYINDFEEDNLSRARYTTQTKHRYYTSITLKNLSYSHDSLTAELRDYANLIKFLNKSKT